MEQLGLKQRAEAAQSWDWGDWGKSSTAFLKDGKAPKGVPETRFNKPQDTNLADCLKWRDT